MVRKKDNGGAHALARRHISQMQYLPPRTAEPGAPSSDDLGISCVVISIHNFFPNTHEHSVSRLDEGGGNESQRRAGFYLSAVASKDSAVVNSAIQIEGKIQAQCIVRIMRGRGRLRQPPDSEVIDAAPVPTDLRGSP
jgi:hypothetical protein